MRFTFQCTTLPFRYRRNNILETKYSDIRQKTINSFQIISNTNNRLLDLSGSLYPPLIYGPRPSCSAEVQGIFSKLKQMA